MASKTEQNSRNKKVVNDLLKIPGNKLCADCNARGPQWASTTQGVFVCIRCAGLHRKLGTHISKVRSVGLDSWNDEQARMVELFGNDKANAVFEAKLDKEKPTPDTDTALVEKFIRAKYERKVWIDKEEEARLYGNIQSGSEESSPGTTPTTVVSLRQSASNQNFQTKQPSSNNALRSVLSQEDVTTTTGRNSGSRTPTPTTTTKPISSQTTNTPSLLSFDPTPQDDLQQFIIKDSPSMQQNNAQVNGKDNVMAMFETTIQPQRNGPPPNQVVNNNN